MASVKGYVWYSPSMFEENGWEVPETCDELIDPDDRDRGDSAVDKPWCVGLRVR